MFGSSRGGVRGGQDQFSWEDVKTDKQRENYLGQRGARPGAGGCGCGGTRGREERGSYTGLGCGERRCRADPAGRALGAAFPQATR